MASKALLFGLFALLLIVSEVATRDLAEKNNDTVDEAQYPDQFGGGGCSYGCCARGYGDCVTCCSYAGEAVKTQPENKPGH